MVLCILMDLWIMMDLWIFCFKHWCLSFYYHRKFWGKKSIWFWQHFLITLIYQIEYLTKQIRKQPLNQKTTQTLWYCSTTYDEDLPDIGHDPKHMQVITYSQHSLKSTLDTANQHSLLLLNSLPILIIKQSFNWKNFSN